MARSEPQERAKARRVAKRAEEVRRQVLEVRQAKESLPYNAANFLLIVQALELLRETASAAAALDGKDR